MVDCAQLIETAVARSRSVAEIAVGEGALAGAGALVRRRFGDGPVCVVADENTRRAGAALFGALAGAGIEVREHVLAAAPRPKPTVELGEAIAEAVGDSVPVALGSGVINDVTKYAAFRLDRRYLCVATAASMDGYSSAGAPLSRAGFKKTLACRAPLAILADLCVVAAAPAQMSAWGYGDVAGKVPAGGDWIIADALGVEPVDDVAWPMVQDNLPAWLCAPAAVRAGEAQAIADLFAGLTLSGLAMEFHGSSRPASGADHQVAHMWEMEGLAGEDGEPVAHGACVAVGAMAILSLYDWLIGRDLSRLDHEAIVAAAPSLDDKRAAIGAAMAPALAERAIEETRAKHLSPEAHRERLAAVAAAWPSLRERLAAHLMRAPKMASLLGAAGAPVLPGDIGIDAARLAATVRAARYIRSRYTVLDLLDECGLFETALAAALPARATA